MKPAALSRWNSKFFSKALIRNNGIARRIMLALLIYSSIITAAITFVELFWDYREDMQDLTARIDSISKVNVPTLSESVWATEELQIQNQLNGLLNLGDIEFVSVAVNGKVEWSAGKQVSERKVEKIISLYRLHRGQNVNIGQLRVVGSVDNVMGRLWSRLVVMLVSNAIKTFLVTTFVLLIFQAMVGQHLEHIAAYLRLFPKNASAAKPLRLNRPDVGRWRPDALDHVVNATRQMQGEIEKFSGNLQASNRRLAATSELLERTGSLAKIGGWELDVATRQITLSREAARIYESDHFSASPTLSQYQACYPPEAWLVVQGATQAAMEQGTPYDLELPFITAKGRPIWVRVQGFPVQEDGKTVQLHGTMQDITERKQTQQDLQVSLKEKTALLLEVHHRVKNNLQVISSLLRLERYRSKDTSTKAVLQDMQARVRSMALLHETIYRKGSFAAIDLGSYLGQIAAEALKSLETNPGAVQLRLDLGSVSVGLDQATPAGMLMSELMSNCFKHGFAEGRRGEVFIVLQPLDEPGHWRLRVSDTGAGLPTDFVDRRDGSMGLQLVGDLAAQMGGTLHIGAGPQAVFTIDFKVEVPAPLVITLGGVKQ